MDATVFMLKNLKIVERQLGNVSNNVARKYLHDCGELVREKAYEHCPKDTGELAKSIDVLDLADDTVGVGTNKEYAVFVHEGTGIYNKDTTRPGGVYWIYIRHPGGSYETYKTGNPGKSKSYATIGEAKRALHYLRDELGLDAHITNGQRPQPFLTQGLQEAEPFFDAILEQAIKEAL